MEHVRAARTAHPRPSRSRGRVKTIRRFSNAEIARILKEMGLFYEMRGIEFKPRAYERAALGVEAFADNVQDCFEQHGRAAIDVIPGVGSGITDHLEQLFTTGHFTAYDRLKKAMPVDIAGLTAVQGIGPQTVKALWTHLRIKNLDELERAAREGKLAGIPRLGPRAQQKILKSIAFMRKGAQRFVLGFAAADVERLRALIARMPGAERVEIAGSYRRRKETIGDIDILVACSNPAPLMRKIVALPLVAHVYGSGETKSSVRLKSGVDTDVRIVPAASWGAALAYFTGSEPHNIALRKIAQRHGWKLSEYGLFKGRKMLAGLTERDIYAHLGLPYIEPELREMTGEIEAAKADALPRLIRYDALRGDLQVQTNWTDGNASIAKMADAAEEAGLEYIAITDHTKSLAMTGGLDETRLCEQAAEIARINKHRQLAGKHLRILCGAEVNINGDGTLDIDDVTLRRLDVVGAAIHTHFDLPRHKQTERLILAMENPNIDIIFHPTGRLINTREEIPFDIDAVLTAAKRTGTVLEIDAFPDRLDLRDEYIRKCVAAGVVLAIDSDAHAPEHYAVLQYGIAQARRGWATRANVINTLPLRAMLRKLKIG